MTVSRIPGLAIIYRYVLAALLWLFFFNAVLDRMASLYLGRQLFTELYYGLLAAALTIRLTTLLRRGEAQPLALSALGLLVFVTLLGAAYGDVIASIFGVKQFFIGLVYLLLFAGHPLPAGTLIVALLLVQGYALLQAIWFVALGTLPPWDMVYVGQLLQTWAARNLYQDELVRPFATFGSFFEYQVVSHMLVIGLFLLRNRLRERYRIWIWLLLASLVAVDALLPERTPIMMGAILLATTWLGLTLVHGARVHPMRPLFGMALLGTFASLFWVVPVVVEQSETTALRRLGEAFRFWEAETVVQRARGEWAIAIEMIRTNPEGAGPAAVATSYRETALTPHNNFFLFAIGYSIVFPFLFFGWLAATFRGLFRTMGAADISQVRLGFCALGITLAYMASSMFNAPFSGYTGAAYFLLLQWLHWAAAVSPAPSTHA